MAGKAKNFPKSFILTGTYNPKGVVGVGVTFLKRADFSEKRKGRDGKLYTHYFVREYKTKLWGMNVKFLIYPYQESWLRPTIKAMQENYRLFLKGSCLIPLEIGIYTGSECWE
jgi:hypothetical protein